MGGIKGHTSLSVVVKLLQAVLVTIHTTSVEDIASIQYLISHRDSVFQLFELSNFAAPFTILTLCVGALSDVLPKWCMDFNWKSTMSNCYIVFHCNFCCDIT